MSNPALDKLIKPEPMHGGLKFLFWLIGLGLIGVIAWFAIDLTGLQAWKQHVAVMRSQGVDLEGSIYVPPAIPDEKNAFKSPSIESLVHQRVAQTEGAIKLLSQPEPFKTSAPLPIGALDSWDSNHEGMPPKAAQVPTEITAAELAATSFSVCRLVLPALVE